MTKNNYIFTDEESKRLHELEASEKEAQLFIEKTKCWKVKNDRTKQIKRIKDERRRIYMRAKRRGILNGKEETTTNA